jgi:hypothetical protein
MCKRFIFLTFVVEVLGVILISRAKAADPDLVGYWRFDEGSGTVAYDTSGNGNDAVFTGDPQWVAGQFGGALEFDGSGDFLDCGNDPSLMISGAVTMTAWIRLGAVGIDHKIGGNQDGANGGYKMSMYNTDKVEFEIRTAANAAVLNRNVAGGTTMDAGVWYHIAGVYSQEDGYIRTYVDGVLDREMATAEALGASPGNLYMGCEPYNTGAYHFNGVMDDLRLYSRALTEPEINGVMLGGGANFPFASSPSPADGTLHADTWVTLSWRAGDFAASHDVYFSDNFDDVNEGTGDAFRGNQGTTYYIAGFPGFAYPDGLVPGTTYYWRIDEVNEADPNSPWRGPVWSFSVPSKKAYDPFPADGTEFVDPTAITLSWTAGYDAKLHAVYLGDDFDTVSNATGGITVGTTTYNPGPLEFNKTYYWRVDEFDGLATNKGDVWSFGTLPEIAITDPTLVGWWKFDESTGTLALDWSGHGNHGEFQGDPQRVAGQIGGALEFDGSGDILSCGRDPSLAIVEAVTMTAWIKVDVLNLDHKVGGNQDGSNGGYKMTVFSNNKVEFEIRDAGNASTLNRDVAGGTTLETGIWYHVAGAYSHGDGYIRTYVDGELDRELQTMNELGASPGTFYIGCEPFNTSSYNFTGVMDDLRLYNRALTSDDIKQTMRGELDLAWNPEPVNGATVDIAKATPLTWSPGDKASEHDVYFGTDETAVADADASDITGVYRGRQSATAYTPPEGVQWGGGPYYWRIDEVNTDQTVSKGRIWTFTVADFRTVDDFESYTDDDDAGEAIWQSWIDGFGVAGNGSQVGYLLPPYAERTIVHSGSQSMPLFYDNTAGVENSEAELKLTSPRDWTERGVAELSLWFRGYPPSTGSFIESPAGTYTMTASGTDIWGTADQFHYAYRMLTGAGSIVAKVERIANTNGWAKAGVMIRETMDPGSKHAFACMTPSNGVAAQGRDATDGDSFNTNQTGISTPYWVKLERSASGNFVVSHSANGATWSPVEGASPRNITMSATVYVGLALTSHDADLTCEAVFSNVTITGSVSGQWASQDINIVSNAAEPLYVAISNAGGAPAIVAHEDPMAATIDTWTQWVIPLQDFADQGINLSYVDKIAIGLGTTGDPAASGGSGTMYIDDIRLYRPGEAAGQ